MQGIESLRPTLWRTCRALANDTRLNMFALLLEQPDQTVSGVAKQLSQPLSLTSEYLRSMEARGLLVVRRRGRWVQYRANFGKDRSFTSRLAFVLKETFQHEAKPKETIFSLTTAFTHPRRIEIFRALQSGPCTLQQLQALTRISMCALYRHLRKLESRGFINHTRGVYGVTPGANGLRRELARLAAV